MTRTRLLIVGAGPFGLALAAEAGRRGIDHLVAGRPMSFWRDHMPAGMYLRLAGDWHLDPAGTDTIERFLGLQGRTRADVEPLSLAFYLSYADWFQQQKRVAPLPVHVRELRRGDGGGFHAVMENGDDITAGAVALALGFHSFPHVPPELAARIPAACAGHTSDVVDLAALKDLRVLILGGRQSAFEWAALLGEAGAASVDIVHRHDSPAFAVADWSWVSPLVDRLVSDPGWFRRLPQAGKDAFGHRLWAEGRLKVEPWLEARCRKDGIRIRPRAQVVSAAETSRGGVEVTLDSGERLTVDRIIFATGYKADITRVPLLQPLLPSIAASDGFPVLDDAMQTSVPGLYVTSYLAQRDFGPWFAFTISVRASAHLILSGQ